MLRVRPAFYHNPAGACKRFLAMPEYCPHCDVCQASMQCTVEEFDRSLSQQKFRLNFHLRRPREEFLH